MAVSLRRDPLACRGRLVVVAAGKAALAMACGAREVLGERIDDGLVIAPGGAVAPRGFAVRLAGHPLPDRRGVRAADAVLSRMRGLSRDDVVLVLLSGGASALLPAPVEGVSLRDKARTTQLLLRSGAGVHELNTVRRHLSRLKGGGLARAAQPARVVTLALSDVVGDLPASIASGPTVPDPTTFADALRVLHDHGLAERVPATVRKHLEAGARGLRMETVKPDAALFRRTTYRVIGSARLAVAAAAKQARRLGRRPEVLTQRLEGEAREVARVLVALLRERLDSPPPGPFAMLAAGETTVHVRGPGRGGRNQELVLAAAAALDGFPAPVLVASLGSDGIDGNTSAAGGVADHTSAARALSFGLAPIRDFLARNDSHRFLASLGDVIVTGATGTNVGDLVVMLAEARRR